MSDYIDHDGKGMPVDGDTLVFIKQAGGYCDEDNHAVGIAAKFWHNPDEEEVPEDSNWFWPANGPTDFHIIAYKVVS